MGKNIKEKQARWEKKFAELSSKEKVQFEIVGNGSVKVKPSEIYFSKKFQHDLELLAKVKI